MLFTLCMIVIFVRPVMAIIYGLIYELGRLLEDIRVAWERKPPPRPPEVHKPAYCATAYEMECWKANIAAGRSTTVYWGQMPPTRQSPGVPAVRM
jgi:hypothetical protein